MSVVARVIGPVTAAELPVVVIPAYCPGPAFVGVIEELRRLRPGVDVLVVDDGSGPAYAPLFAQAEALGATVLHQPANGGKGAALKAGFAFLDGLRLGRVVVCADADGQHLATDVLRVADAVDPGRRDQIVLGVREFDGAVPLRSRIGNDATQLLFRLATGSRLRDTQTGLRAFPAELLPWLLQVGGERYEYELTMLLQASRSGIDLRTVPIETVYLDDNSSSHFRPVVDSLRIYRPLLAFLGSSLLGFAIDVVMVIVLQACFGSLLLAVLGARLTSACVNFAVNRSLVFDHAHEARLGRAVRRYAALAVVVLGLNYLLLATLVTLGVPLLPAKLLTEIALVTLSFTVQSRVVFRTRSRGRESAGTWARSRSGVPE
ncbi:MAG: bifunctional glycosyltransferase family 2/GtrA family protein [Nocardioides sp.]|uniref:glycosyltransferase n=1 Tax=Nocardioides sp. TaxID=35761 RepID=UPI0039E64BD4